jgi:hypothetical protein
LLQFKESFEKPTDMKLYIFATTNEAVNFFNANASNLGDTFRNG